jgi:prephenate dehydrogenase
MKVAIIGVGAMGRWFANFAKQHLGDVVVADIDVAKARRTARELEVEMAETCAEAVSGADVAIIAVPIAKTPEVVKSLGEHMRRGSLLMDIASAKGAIVDVMRGLDVKPELVSIHPLFGPGATSVRGKDFVVVPVKPGRRYREFARRLTKLGARITKMEAEEHDRIMAISQCLTHFVLLSYLSALKSMKGLKRAEGLQTPMFASLLELAKAVLAGNPDLYGEVQVQNKYAQVTRSVLMEACRSLDIAFAARDVKTPRKIFEEALALWGQGDVQAAYKRLYEYFEREEKI